MPGTQGVCRDMAVWYTSPACRTCTPLCASGHLAGAWFPCENVSHFLSWFHNYIVDILFLGATGLAQGLAQQTGYCACSVYDYLYPSLS